MLSFGIHACSYPQVWLLSTRYILKYEGFPLWLLLWDVHLSYLHSPCLLCPGLLSWKLESWLIQSSALGLNQRSGEESNERRKINAHLHIYFIAFLLHCHLRYSYRTPRIVPRTYLYGRAKSIFICKALDKSGVIRGTQRIKTRSTTVKALSSSDTGGLADI
jgi:hypothetical protein